MAMAGGYVLADELARQKDHRAAFAAYQDVLKRSVDKRQKDAARFASLFVPSVRSRPWLHRLTLRLLFGKALLKLVMPFFGSKSALSNRV
jgi:2-polyprenyl-6-methoxyphenol hydroxylase-like FAD-dependent oxidoreductase